MTANCRRCHGFGSTLAPASRRIVNFLRFGRTAAIAGRSTPGSTPITNIEITIAAPVFPAETRAVAFPSFTSATTTAGPWSPPMASTATFRLGPFDGDDLPALVVAAVRADSVRQLDLAALRTERARRRGKLVVRAALAPARLRVTSFRQRHGGVSLARASRRRVC